MTESRQTVGLCMIVKNEAPVIARCLSSVRPIIDHWLIVDTGSTDGTQDIVRAAMKDVPGRLVERPWVDFAHNRSEALALARACADFALIIDADDTLAIPAGFVMPALTEDCYAFDIDFAGCRYHRPQMVSNRLRWVYRGVLHEFLHCDEPFRTGALPLTIRINTDGARRRSAQTFRRDIEILQRALRDETDPRLRPRYTFYLAQSHRDCGELESALQGYLARAAMGGWSEEVYVSLYQAARIMEALGRDDDAVIAAYLRAAETAPHRVEALHGASRLCRLRERFAQGFDIAARGLGRPLPRGALFAESWIYETGLRDEYAVNAYWTGRYDACLAACLDILEHEGLSADDRQRVAANARFAMEKLKTPVCA